MKNAFAETAGRTHEFKLNMIKMGNQNGQTHGRKDGKINTISLFPLLYVILLLNNANLGTLIYPSHH